MQQPRLDHLLSQFFERLDGVQQKLVTNRNIDAGGALHPVEHKILLLDWQQRDGFSRDLDLIEGEFNLQRLIELPDDLFNTHFFRHR